MFALEVRPTANSGVQVIINPRVTYMYIILADKDLIEGRELPDSNSSACHYDN